MIENETNLSIESGLSHINFRVLVDIYIGAFSGYPWFETNSTENITQIIEKNAQKKGFTIFCLEDKNNNLIGASWFDTPSLDELETEKGVAIRTFSENKMKEEGLHTLIFVRDTIVKPDQQGKGVASYLKDTYLKFIQETFTDGVLLITRHKDDNFAIIKTSEKRGFLRSGVRMPSKQDQNVFNEYWYKIFKYQQD